MLLSCPVGLSSLQQHLALRYRPLVQYELGLLQFS